MTKTTPLWEVFIRPRNGLSHKHVGSLHASDKTMAINAARDVYTRRNEGTSIWVVPSISITASDPDKADENFEPSEDKIYRHPTFYDIPEYIDETIFYLGSSYAFIWKNIGTDIFFNGNHHLENIDFDQYLKRFGYTFKNEVNELGGYAILKNKKIILAMDVGSSPSKHFSIDYQYGALSFEIFSNQKRLITNAGYFSNKDNKPVSYTHLTLPTILLV